MADDSLFRPESLDAQRTHWLGPVTLHRRPSFQVFTLIALLCAAALVTFIVQGSYTKRSTVSGQLLPTGGWSKVFPPQTAVVIERHVREGQAVKRGELLYVLSLDRPDRVGDNSLARISAQVEQRRASLAAELDELVQLQQEERSALILKRDTFRTELTVVGQAIAGQRKRIALSKDTLERYRDLLARDYIAGEQVQLREADWIDQRSRLQALDRDRLNIERELQSITAELERQPLEFERQRGELRRRIVSAEQELTESEMRRRIAVTAPRDGVATAAIAELGQTVDPARPLVAVVPHGATLQAHLFATSRAVGFMRAGDRVKVRLDAFPYQKFGHLEGRVDQIARVALSGQELAAIALADATQSATEPLYRVTVSLPAQTIRAYGEERPLQVGMRVEADVMLETRRLYEWALAPLLSISGRL